MPVPYNCSTYVPEPSAPAAERTEGKSCKTVRRLHGAAASFHAPSIVCKGIIMKLKLLSAFLFLQAISSGVQAQEAPPNTQAPAEIKPATKAEIDAAQNNPFLEPGARILHTNCYTNQQGCAGVAWFYGNGNTVSCSVYFNNGSSGQSNFVIPNGQSHGIHVQYRDTYACVWGGNGVPNGTPRNYIFVK